MAKILMQPNYPKDLLKYGKLGYRPKQVAKIWGVSRQTLYNWCEIPEFGRAFLEYRKKL